MYDIKIYTSFVATIFKFVEGKDQFLIYLDYLGFECFYIYLILILGVF